MISELNPKQNTRIGFHYVKKKNYKEEAGDFKYKCEMSKKTNTTMLKLFPLGFILLPWTS